MMSRYRRRLPRHLLPLIERDRDWIADVIRSGNVKAFAYAWGQNGLGVLPQYAMHWSVRLCAVPDFHIRISDWLCEHCFGLSLAQAITLAEASCNPGVIKYMATRLRDTDRFNIRAVAMMRNTGDMELLEFVVRNCFVDRSELQDVLDRAVRMGHSRVEMDRIAKLRGADRKISAIIRVQNEMHPIAL